MITSEHYATLDEALSDIARRSFYESAVVKPSEDGNGYDVADRVSGYEESYPYTYETGGQYPDAVIDRSRVHETCEFYDAASHVRNNLTEAVARLESGRAVIFQYVTLEAVCFDPVIYDDATGEATECMDDHLAGWALIAFDGEADA